jgi:hypothetical protein
MNQKCDLLLYLVALAFGALDLGLIEFVDVKNLLEFFVAVLTDE